MLSDYSKIIYQANLILQPDAISLRWGKALLAMLGLDGLGPAEKAHELNAWMYRSLRYSSSRHFQLADVIRHGGGNCVAHANLGVFLLRHAGVQPKYAHEMHVIKKSIYSQIIAYNTKKPHEGINGEAHNDHVWVWFQNGENDWQPFDSALGYAGFDELFEKMVFDRKRHCRSYIEKRTGPPFLFGKIQAAGWPT